MSATHARSRILVGLAATAGAFGAAAMMSAATAPTARADDFSDIISAVDGDYTQGNAAFASALSDFGSSDFSQGFAQILDGVDDYSLSPTLNLTVGTLEASAGDAITGSEAWGLTVPASFSDALSLAESDFATGETDLADAASYLASADYVDATFFGSFGAEYVSIIPLEELLLGTIASF
jgi:hypothetical protein